MCSNNIVERATLIKALSGSMVMLATGGKVFVKRQTIEFSCRRHGKFHTTPKDIMDRAKQRAGSACKKCNHRRAVTNIEIEQIEGEIGEILKRAKMMPLTVEVPTLSKVYQYKCNKGHITECRAKEMKHQLESGETVICAECKAIRHKDYESRVANIKKSIDKQLEKYPDVKLIDDYIPARKNAVLKFDCTHHGKLRVKVADMQANPICQQCAKLIAEETMSPIEAWLKNNFSWRRKGYEL